jgi:hypothetical protein
MKECIICGSPVSVPSDTEISVCNNDNCIRVVDDSIGLHQQPITTELRLSEHFKLLMVIGSAFLHINI